MNIDASVTTAAFTAAIRGLSKAAGVSIPRVVAYEAGKVLESAAKKTVAIDTGRVTARHEAAEFTRQDIGSGLKLYNLRYKYPDVVWARLQAKRAASLKRKLAARGLAKQAWLRLAQAAQLEIKVPAYVRKAIPTSGRQYPENAEAHRAGSGTGFEMRFSTTQPTLWYAGGQAAILSSLAGRTRFFERNLRLGVFDDLRAVARRYPGLRVN